MDILILWGVTIKKILELYIKDSYEKMETINARINNIISNLSLALKNQGQCIIEK